MKGLGCLAEFLRVSLEGAVGSEEGQAHRLLCSPVVKQWKSIANTALFPHGCSACQACWKGFFYFSLFRCSQLEDAQLSQPERKHAVRSTRGIESHRQGPPRGLGNCLISRFFTSWRSAQRGNE